MIMVAGMVVSINYKSRMQYGSVKGVENMIFNKKRVNIICRVVKWAVYFAVFFGKKNESKFYDSR